MAAYLFRSEGWRLGTMGLIEFKRRLTRKKNPILFCRSDRLPGKHDVCDLFLGVGHSCWTVKAGFLDQGIFQFKVAYPKVFFSPFIALYPALGRVA
jgi:hypothetical protein